MSNANAKAAPQVAVSIAPLHSLVAAVMQGVGEPALLIPSGQSPHGYQLRPSELSRLSQSQLVLWIGPEFELSLRKPIDLLPDIQKVSALGLPDMVFLQSRRSGLWDHGHSHGEIHEHGGAHDDEHIDPHLWLSSDNALTIAQAVAAVLVEMDPDHRDIYQENLTQLKLRIEALRGELMDTLEPYGDLPYLVFHDAYHYFEHEYGLNPVGSVTLSPDRSPGAQTVRTIKQAIDQQGVRCIFSEPQFEPRLVRRLAEETGLWVGEIDPVGATLEPGPDLWFELIEGLRDSLLDCARR